MKTIKTMINKLTVIAVLFSLLFASCGDDDQDNPVAVNEEETITTVKLTVTETGSTNATVYTWTEATQDDIQLVANTSYNFKIQFLDASDPNDVEDITEEVIEEKDEHFVFYNTTVDGLTFASASDDTIDGDTIGINISTDWSASIAGTGILKAFLIHEPTSKRGTVRDDFGGETDVEVTFSVSVITDF